jgi:phosphatidate phosphatase APP1
MEIDEVKTYSPLKQSLFQKIKQFFFRLLKLNSSATIKLYNGFGNTTHCFIYGHALHLSPISRKRFHNNFITNSLALLRLFMVKPMTGARVELDWEGETFSSMTEKDGFFKFEWSPKTPLNPGLYKVNVRLIHRSGKYISSTASSEISVPALSRYAFISDIDDTFLISHSSNLRKRLFVLLTENARSRKPFEGVVKHYRALSLASASATKTNPFFYVSSSEWNLYDYIREFSVKNKLPNGIYLLNQLKQFNQIFKTGQNNHNGKFTRIVRILETFPGLKFILLGDDSQQDPYIYSSIVSHFPGKIACVYIRAVNKTAKPEVKTKLKEIEEAGIECCYFNHSSDAIMHSERIGLIGEKTMQNIKTLSQ